MERKATLPYRAYMLRLWAVQDGSDTAWRASLEDPHTGQRQGFRDLDSLFDFLNASIGDQKKDSANSASVSLPAPRPT